MTLDEFIRLQPGQKVLERGSGKVWDVVSPSYQGDDGRPRVNLRFGDQVRAERWPNDYELVGTTSPR